MCGNNNNLAPGPYLLRIKMSFLYNLLTVTGYPFMDLYRLDNPGDYPEFLTTSLFIAFGSSFF